MLSPIIKLREKELDVLGQLLYSNNELKHIEEENRWIIIMSYENKKKMQDIIGLSSAYWDNCCTELRKKGILKNNKVEKNFLFYPDKNIKVIFDFIIE